MTSVRGRGLPVSHRPFSIGCGKSGELVYASRQFTRSVPVFVPVLGVNFMKLRDLVTFSRRGGSGLARARLPSQDKRAWVTGDPFGTTRRAPAAAIRRRLGTLVFF